MKLISNWSDVKSEIQYMHNHDNIVNLKYWKLHTINFIGWYIIIDLIFN